MKHNATKIQAYVRMKIQEKKYTISLQEEKIQADMAYQLRLLQERLQEEQKRNLSLELDREQEDQVFPTMSDSNSSRGKVSFVPPPRVRKKSSAHLVMADAGGMIERMQEENARLRKENDELRTTNARMRDESEKWKQEKEVQSACNHVKLRQYEDQVLFILYVMCK